MGIEKLNQYRIDFVDNVSEIFMAKNGRAALNALETDARPVAQLTRIAVGVGVETPIRNVKFDVSVWPDNAEANNCLATPKTWIVPEGTKVIFTAIPAPGFQFDGWYTKEKETLLSDEAVAELQVDYPDDPAALSAVFEAHFSPIPVPPGP